MLITFLTHQWKAFWRSKNKGSTIAAQIFLAFITLYLLALALVIGFTIEHWIGEFFPKEDAFAVFNGFILYYFALDFLMRLQLQDLPTLSIVPYLHLNIPKSKIVNFLNVRAIFNAFNVFPLFIFIPFSTTFITDIYGGDVSAMYCIAIISLIVSNNYTALYTKRLTTASTKFVLFTALVIVTAALLEYFQVYSIKAISHVVFSYITIHPAAALVFSLFAAIMFYLNSRYLKNNLYTEELSDQKEKKTSTDYPFLDRFGEIGTLVALELKLILRHKRTRSVLTMSLVFVFYGFLFYKKEFIDKDAFGMLLFAAIFMTGSSISIYGQFMFGWQAAHFDGIMANKTNFRNFIKAKFLLFTLMSTITTLIISLYGIISWKILLLQFAAYFYNIGIGTVIVLYFATRNYKAIDLSKGATFNYQGVGASQFILGIPYFLAPYLFYGPFAVAGMPYAGLACLGAFGLAGFLTRDYWVAFILKEFNKKKYKIAEGFRHTP